MRLTDLLTWTPATKPVLYHDVARHQTAFSSPTTPPWRVGEYRHFVTRERQPRRDEPGKRLAPPAVRPTGTRAAHVPLRPFRGRVPAGSNQTNTWI
mgnify:CR=1 FL=1